MAYILGLIYSDGAIEDVRSSSRTCYFTISSNNKTLLVKVRKALSSNHTIYFKKPRMVKFTGGKFYLCRKTYILRVGNKKMFDDLVDLGLTPRKSLKLVFPQISHRYFGFFLRGYFDGDGCVMDWIQKRRLQYYDKKISQNEYNKLEDLSTKLYAQQKDVTTKETQKLIDDFKQKQNTIQQ